jgi:hypothetical protein
MLIADTDALETCMFREFLTELDCLVNIDTLGFAEAKASVLVEASLRTGNTTHIEHHAGLAQNTDFVTKLSVAIEGCTESLLLL